VLFRRYHADDQWIRNPLSTTDSQRLTELEQVFRHYADRYGFDWLGIAALAYQESGLDPDRRSPKGAVGIMQILPSTAADPNVGIPDVSSLEDNVHAGVRYLAFLRDRYFNEAGISESARFDFALAAYNAGPRRVGDFRRRAAALGLDPNRWFRNVELAALELAGRETVRYVARVNKYYVAYRLARRTRQFRTASLTFP
jgi:membrane-bound lytic murein transglycosylase MltF